MRELQINIYTFGVNNGLKMLKQPAVQKRTVTRMSRAFLKIAVVWGIYFRLSLCLIELCAPFPRQGNSDHHLAAYRYLSIIANKMSLVTVCAYYLRAYISQEKIYLTEISVCGDGAI